MPITSLRPRLRTIAKIRAGIKKPPQKPGGKKFPAALRTFRITSPSRHVVDLAAQAWGGTVEQWEEPLANPPRQWQVITEVDTLPVLIPPIDGGFSQWNEMWSAAGCARRCDSEWETLTGAACMCPKNPDERRELAKKGEACQPTTRLTVVVQELEEFGGVDFESKSWWTAREMFGTAPMLYHAAQSRGVLIPADLHISPRSRRDPGQPVLRYVVTELVSTFTSTLAVMDVAGRPRPQIATGNVELEAPRRALPAAPPEAGAGDEDYLDPDDTDGDPATSPPNGPAEGLPAGDVDHGQDQPPDLPGDDGLPIDVDERIGLLMRRGHEAGLEDDETCDLVAAATRSRSRNPRHLNSLEWTVTFALVNKIRRGDISLTADEQRPRRICDPQGRRLHVAWDNDATLTFTVETSDIYMTGRDWQELIRGTGITKTALLRQAAAIAGELGQASPTLDTIHDPDLATRLHAWIDQQKQGAAR